MHSDRQWYKIYEPFSTYKDKPSLFRKHLETYKIWHKVNRPFTPRHSGKAERNHSEDNEPQPTSFILSRILQYSARCIASGIITISLCVLLDGKHLMEYCIIIYSQCNICLANLQIIIYYNFFLFCAILFQMVIIMKISKKGEILWRLTALLLPALYLN